MRRLSWTVMMLVGLAACSTINVDRDYDPSADFGAIRTFKIGEGRIIAPTGEVDQRDTLLDDRVRHALGMGLKQKGLQPSNEPDVLVFYTMASTDVFEAVPYDAFGGWYFGAPFGWNPWWVGPGPRFYGSVGYGWGYDVRRYRTTSLRIDIVDAQSHELIFRAEADARNGKSRTPKRIAEVIEKALEDFPPSADD